jgi:hypothetical protein
MFFVMSNSFLRSKAVLRKSCDREGWERLRELAVDREQLDDSFDAWERGAQAAIAELAAMGRVVRKVPIDIEALLAWCQAQDRPLDSAARAEYVTHLLQQRY